MMTIPAIQVFEGNGFEPADLPPRPDYPFLHLDAAETVNYHRISVENGVHYRQITLYAIDKKTAQTIRAADHKTIGTLAIKDKTIDARNVMIIRHEAFQHEDDSDLGIKLDGMKITIMW